MTTPAGGDHLDLATMHVIPTPAPTVGARKPALLAAEHHLPLLNLTADEVAALTEAAWAWCDDLDPGPHPPHLRSALDKLTTSTEEPA